MDRAAKLIAKLKLPKDCLPPEELVRAAWPQTVGKRIANRTRVIALEQSSLIVEVEDAIWQSQLWTLRKQILLKLRGIAGPDAVSEIEFRVRIPRRLPQRAELPQRAARDEADRIGDPVLRRVYLSSRRRSLA